MSKTSKWLCIGMSLLIILCSVPLFLASASDGFETNLGTQWTNKGTWTDGAAGKVLTAKSGDWGRTFATGTAVSYTHLTLPTN